MLTTVYGGQVVEFVQPLDGEWETDDPLGSTRVRVVLEGDVVAEFLGVDFRGNVGHLPMSVTSGPGGFAGPADLYGGAGTGSGVLEIGPTTIIDLTGPTLPVLDPDTEFTEDYNISALASVSFPLIGPDGTNYAGWTYGFDVMPPPGGAQDQGGTPRLLRINNYTGEAVVVASLMELLPWDEEEVDGVVVKISTAVTITAADFRPMDGTPTEGLLFFVVQTDPDEGDPDQILYALDVVAAETDRTAFESQGLLPARGIMGNEDDSMTSIAWDQTSPTSSKLWGVRQGDGGDASTRIVPINQMCPNFMVDVNHAIPVNFLLPNPNEEDDDTDLEITGIEFVADSPLGEERYLWAVDIENDWLVRIDLLGDEDTGAAPGDALGMGYLVPQEEEEVQTELGSELQSLSWNPMLVNPWTGGYGAMIATDAATGTLVHVRTGSSETDPALPMLWGAASAMVIHVTHAGPGARISLSALNDLGEVVPFDGAIADMLVNPFDGGDPDEPPTVSGPDGSGLVVLGGMGGLNEEVDGWAPIILGRLVGEVGARPRNWDDLPADDSNNIFAGMVLPQDLLDYFRSGSLSQRMLGMNLDDIREMAVSRAGQIVVADFDGYDAAGESYYDLNGDGVWDVSEIVPAEIGLIDYWTGRATDLTPDDDDGNMRPPAKLYDADTGLGIRGVWGLDYGELAMDGNEDLYAVVSDMWGNLYLGWIDLDGYDSGSIEFHSRVDLTALGITEVTAMAFSPGAGSIQGQQGLYLVDGDSTAYEFDPATGAMLRNIGQILGVQHYPDGTEKLDPDGNPLVEPIRVESMDFDDNGVLYGHDRYNGRLVDINLDTLTAGEQTHTPVGSLRPTVGVISYDFGRDEFLAVDNAFGFARRANEVGWAENDDGIGADIRSNDSSVLMVLRGRESDSAVDQTIDTVMIAGTVMGKVDISGSVELFYAGWLITGHTEGLVEEQPITFVDNFHVGGDLRNFITVGAIGSAGGSDDDDAVSYVTGADFRVGGKVGQIFSLDSISTLVDVENQGSTTNYGRWDVWPEIELQSNLILVEEARRVSAWLQFRLHRNSDFYNDSFDTAQYLGTSRGSAPDGIEGVTVNGVLEVDEALDYYALSLMAGQTVTVWFINSGAETVNIGVFDPDRRLVATNTSDTDTGAVATTPFRVTAERAGIYYFVAGAPPFDGATPYVGDNAYQLNLAFEDKYKNLGLGAIVSRVGVQGSGAPTFHVQRGDLGAIVAGGDVYGCSIQTSAGNVRAIQGVGIGVTDPETLRGSSYPSIYTYGGGVGLIRATGGANWLGVEYAYIEGDVQTIDAASFLVLPQLLAFGGIGNIRAGSMADELRASVIYLNIDNYGGDGIIDLIDVDGDFGAPLPGGPWIYTGQGGNIRFMRIGGEIYQPLDYADSTPVTVNGQPGQSFTLWDDSGAKIVLNPVPVTVDARTGDIPVDPLTGLNVIDPSTGLPFVLPSLSFRVFAAADGGVVLVDVTSSGSLEIVTDSHQNGAPAEVGTITLTGTGRAVQIDDPIAGTMSQAPNPYAGFNTDLTVLVRNENGQGDGPLDVWNIVGGDFTFIRNETGGDIVGVDAASIGLLASRGGLGVTANHTGAEVDAINVLSDAMPFSQQTTGIVSGSIITAWAGRGLGNFIVSGTVGALTANYEGVVNHLDGDYRGIVAPVHITGDLYRVQIGEGIAPTGTGGFAQAGIFVEGEIRNVTNQGQGSDIHGDIFGSLGIRRIDLIHGSIINADIGTPMPEYFAALCEFSFGGLFSGNIGQINLTGVGGIIGSRFQAGRIGGITVKNGFGVFNSIIGSTGGDGTIGDVVVDGFGLYDVEFTGGSIIRSIVATGRGLMGDTLRYTPTVRYSEQQTDYDPFGRTITDLIDIHEMLLTSVDSPLSTEGMFYNVKAGGQL
ncbi:MAG: hypothetical protein GX591_15790, partial [Planctomycetes bacterium]|nr:hypothetical protein [Planctomycetota bacterium]